MRKKTPNAKRAHSLPKTSKKKDIELTEKELEKVSGGRQIPGTIKYSDVTLKRGV